VELIFLNVCPELLLLYCKHHHLINVRFRADPIRYSFDWVDCLTYIIPGAKFSGKFGWYFLCTIVDYRFSLYLIESNLPMWKQKDTDRMLVEIAIAATILFAFLATTMKQCSIRINFLFIIIVSSSFYLHSLRLGVNLSNLPALFYKRIFDGTDQRYYLLLFYLICVFATLIFCIIVNHLSHSSTVHRKFFHLTVSLICITGIQYDFEFIWLSAWLTLCIFVIIEVFRSKCVSPWSKYLNDWLLIFIDKQDSPKLILTPIYLMAGIFLPLFLSPIANNEYRHLYHFAGVATIGVGDSLAAIIGSKYGRLYWPKSQKTMEGSVAFAIGQFIFCILICLYYLKCDINMYQLLWIMLSSFTCAFFEAILPAMDNIILPVIAYLILS
ncbi:Uncharacterized protein BM_BM6885, partial [Brugia malayi]